MAIFLCEQCDYCREVSSQHIDKKAKCPHCGAVSYVVDTIKLIKTLKSETTANNREDIAPTTTKLNKNTVTAVNLSNLNVGDTEAFTDDKNIIPVKQWFQKKNIEITVNKAAIDTTGFFDEVAELIGSNYEVLSYVTNQIKYIQSKGHENIKIALAKKNKQEKDQIITFCRRLYEYSFVSKYFYDKKEKAVRMIIQPSAIIRNFFNGEWLEWYVFISLIKEIKKQGVSVNAVRNLNIQLANGKLFELDVFLLINNQIPVLIECKSGEFRKEIDKYIDLKKRLKFDSQSFFLFALDLDETQCKGMSAMYDITFVNNENFKEKFLSHALVRN